MMAEIILPRMSSSPPRMSSSTPKMSFRMIPGGGGTVGGAPTPPPPAPPTFPPAAANRFSIVLGLDELILGRMISAIILQASMLLSKPILSWPTIWGAHGLLTEPHTGPNSVKSAFKYYRRSCGSQPVVGPGSPGQSLVGPGRSVPCWARAGSGGRGRAAGLDSAEVREEEPRAFRSTKCRQVAGGML